MLRAFGLYGSRCLEHLGSPLFGERAGGDDVDLDTEEFLQLHANFTDIEEGGLVRRIDQEFQVAVGVSCPRRTEPKTRAFLAW